MEPRKSAVLFLLLGSEILRSQAGGAITNRLPSPTGAVRIGRVSYHWIDSARRELLASMVPSYRELMVDVWYPAETTAGHAPAPYLVDLPAVETLGGQASARKQFGAAYERMIEGSLQTHAQEEAVFARGVALRPVLVFSHGLGVLKTSYTALLEDLASNGYVVAAIAHTYDTALVTFPNGRVVRQEQERRRAASGSEHASIQYENGRMKVWAADVRFVVDQLTRYDREAEFGAPFQGHLDLARIGTLGHSSGGRAAGLACQTARQTGGCAHVSTWMGSPATCRSIGMCKAKPWHSRFFCSSVSVIARRRAMRNSAAWDSAARSCRS